MHGAKTPANEAADSACAKGKPNGLTPEMHFAHPRADAEGHIPHFCRYGQWTKKVQHDKRGEFRKSSNRELGEVLRGVGEEGKS